MNPNCLIASISSSRQPMHSKRVFLKAKGITQDKIRPNLYHGIFNHRNHKDFEC